MRIARGGVIHETNTFCKGLTPAEDFRQLAGQEIIDAHTGVRSYQGGVIEAAGRHGYDLVPIFVANATPSATIARDAYERCATGYSTESATRARSTPSA
ncbi:MAG: M81 family metallopeptidase [Thermomicrobiales bacterium]